MAYFNSKQVKYIPQPVPVDPGIYPPDPPTPPTPTPGSDPNIPRPTFSGNVSVVIGYTTDENNKVDKNMVSIYNTTISVKDDMSVINPVFYVTSPNDLNNANYMQLMNRFYYIVDKEVLPGNLWKLTGREDVLMTFNRQIKAQTAIISRNSNQYNLYLQDSAFKIYSYKNTRTLKFSTGFSKNLNFVLTTVGGAGT